MSGNDDVTTACMVEICTLKDKLQEKEREMEEITKSWQERLRQSEERKQQEAKSLEVRALSGFLLSVLGSVLKVSSVH